MKCHLLIILCLSLLVACSSNGPTIDYDTHTDFSNYQYYTLVDNTEKNKNSLMAQRIQSSLNDALANAPLTLASQQHPADIIIDFRQTVKEKTKVNQNRGSVGLGGGGGGNVGMGVSLSFPFGDTQEQTITIVIDFTDTKTDKLIWRGSEEVTLPQEEAAQATELINEIVMEIIQSYPPQAPQ